jgi:hypothetical protein
VTGRDAPGSNMPSFPWPARRDGSAVEDTALTALLEGGELPDDAAARLQPVADMLAALRAEAASDELTGLAAAQAEFRRRIAPPARPHQPRRRRRVRLASLLGAKAATAGVVVAIGLGGAGAAAYAGALPVALQQFAHRTIGAPAPRQAGSGTGRGPHAVGGLCAAYQRARIHGTPAQQAAALRSLVKAAGGAANVTAFCAAVPQGHSSPARAHPFPRHVKRPAAHPSKRKSGRPRGHQPKPAQGPPVTHVPGQPTTHPSPHRAEPHA